MERQLIEISTGTILKFIFLGLVLAFLFVIRDIVAIFLLAIVIAYALDPAINWFQNKKIPRVFAVLFIYIGSLAVLTLLFYLIVPPLFFEVKNFAAESPQFLEKITIPLTNQNLEGASIIPPSLLENIQDFFGSISNLLANFSQGFIQTLIRLFGGIFSAVLILVIAFYLSYHSSSEIRPFFGAPCRPLGNYSDFWTDYCRFSRRCNRFFAGTDFRINHDWRLFSYSAN